ncbi:hypothetical protein QJQ45_008801 [Haematococcus lacustris]|nr:hypothetical protein QJQ45_008801 [Haematococcus lacustris]
MSRTAVSVLVCVVYAVLVIAGLGFISHAAQDGVPGNAGEGTLQLSANWRTTPRLALVPDIHGDLQQALHALKRLGCNLKPPAAQVDPRLLRPAWSQQLDQPVRGLMWSLVVAPRKLPQAPCSSQEATQPAPSEPGPSTPLPAMRTLNMQRIGESRWHPLELFYWPDQGALPAKGKEYPELGYKGLRDRPPKAQQQQQPALAWAGGRSSLVQTGDIVDRGPDSLAALHLFHRLKAEASAAGGDVVTLLGNHELMLLQGDTRYFNPSELQHLARLDIHPFLTFNNISHGSGHSSSSSSSGGGRGGGSRAAGHARLMEALQPGAPLGQLLRTRPIAHVAYPGSPCNTLFVHAALLPWMLDLFPVAEEPRAAPPAHDPTDSPAAAAAAAAAAGGAGGAGGTHMYPAAALAPAVKGVDLAEGKERGSRVRGEEAGGQSGQGRELHTTSTSLVDPTVSPSLATRDESRERLTQDRAKAMPATEQAGAHWTAAWDPGLMSQDPYPSSRAGTRRRALSSTEGAWQAGEEAGGRQRRRGLALVAAWNQAVEAALADCQDRGCRMVQGLAGEASRCRAGPAGRGQQVQEQVQGWQTRLRRSGQADITNIIIIVIIIIIKKEGQQLWGQLLGGSGPVWSRHYTADPDTQVCAGVARVAAELGVSRVVVGHTIQEHGMTERCGLKRATMDKRRRQTREQGRTHSRARGRTAVSASGADAPPPSTSLLDLPTALLADIAVRAGLEAVVALAGTCFACFQAGLLHMPAFRIQLDSKLLTPRIVAALRARTDKLALTLQQPQANESSQLTRLLAHVLGKLGSCAAVETCELRSRGVPLFKTPKPKGSASAPVPGTLEALDCTPHQAQHLLSSFPGLTALSIHGFAVTCNGLASLLAHPQLSLQLQQLDITGSTITQPEQPGGATLDNLFCGARLKQLSLDTHIREMPSLQPLAQHSPQLHMPDLRPLAQHLTQLRLVDCLPTKHDLTLFVAVLKPLAQLQVLTLTRLPCLLGLLELLPALRQLHTLQLPNTPVTQDKELDVLLAATQLTSIQLCSVWDLVTSRADAPCSWQHLELTGSIDSFAAAYLPLHSLTHPLVLEALVVDMSWDFTASHVAAVIHNLAHACKAPVVVKSMEMEKHGWTSSIPKTVWDDLEQLVVSLRTREGCCLKQVEIMGILDDDDDDYDGYHDDDEEDAEGVSAWAPMLQGCTRLHFWGGRRAPSLKFWCQVVQLMPTVSHAENKHHMHNTLQMDKRRRRNLGQDDTTAPTEAADAHLTPATSLLDLPTPLLDSIVSRAMEDGANSALASTCSILCERLLLLTPSFRIKLDRQRCDQPLTPRIVAALQTRTVKLALTLHLLPAQSRGAVATEQLLAQGRGQHHKVLAHVLVKLGSCAGVEACILRCSDSHQALECSPGLAQHLLDSFPNLTALSLRGFSVTYSGLASMLSHPQLDMQLQFLDLADTTVREPTKPGEATLPTPFRGLKLSQLRIDPFTLSDWIVPRNEDDSDDDDEYIEDVTAWSEALASLQQLQVLIISELFWVDGLAELLQALPQLRNLHLPNTTVTGEEALDELLAATQLMSIQLEGVCCLETSRADAPCSWQQLEVDAIDAMSVAYLPLYSLTQPLVLGRLDVDLDDGPLLDMAAVIHNITHACQVPVIVKKLRMQKGDTPEALQDQSRYLEQLAAACQLMEVTIEDTADDSFH